VSLRWKYPTETMAGSFGGMPGKVSENGCLGAEPPEAEQFPLFNKQIWLSTKDDYRTFTN